MNDDAGSWRAGLRCTQAEAEAVAMADPIDALPVLLAREVDPIDPAQWLIEAYFTAKPDSRTIELLRSLAPSAAGLTPTVERIAPADWLTVSQAGLEPVRAGRFFVHTAAHAAAVPNGGVTFHIEAGRAFGTGHHETTTACLLMLDQLKQEGARFTSIADVGTGTGLLAFAALKLWSGATVTASDIDPVAIEVAAENAAANAIPLGTLPGMVELVTAAGLKHRRLRRRTPFDLIIANILAGPLIDMAATLSAALQSGGQLILAGLLDDQVEAVVMAYRRQGMRLAGQVTQGDWPTLRLVKRRRVMVRSGSSAHAGRAARS